MLIHKYDKPCCVGTDKNAARRSLGSYRMTKWRVGMEESNLIILCISFRVGAGGQFNLNFSSGLSSRWGGTFFLKHCHLCVEKGRAGCFLNIFVW